QSYPKNERKNIAELHINNKNLEDYLDLSDFLNLKHLDCSNNRLASLNVTSCLQLKTIQCDSNELTSLDLNGLSQLSAISCGDNYLTSFDCFHSNLNFENLIALNIENNNFTKQDLSCVSHLTNLQYLFIGNNKKERIEKNIYNRFCGSLEPLKNISGLEVLGISNTDINSGLEYLPKSLSVENIYYSSEYRPESQAK
ncbi:11191_t:CDS:1, partial [Racocetra persica]